MTIIIDLQLYGLKKRSISQKNQIKKDLILINEILVNKNQNYNKIIMIALSNNKIMANLLFNNVI